MKNRLHVRGCLGALTLWLAACSSTEELQPPPPAAACDEPTGEPVVHQGIVSAAETWTASRPHLISFNLILRAAVTVEACAVVRVAAGTSVEVDSGGSLVTAGISERPVRFEPAEQGKPWGQIRVSAPGTARLTWTNLLGGGDSSFKNGTLYVGNSSALPGPRLLFVDHVTITGSSSPGVWLAGTTGFAEGSTDLTITSSGSQAVPEPVALNPNALGTLPSGRYTGNRSDALFVSLSVASSSVWYLGQDATVRDLGVPYRVDGLRVGHADFPATLTVEAGVELRFTQAKTLEVYDSHSALVATGSTERPVIFTSASATPAPGDWTGLSFGGLNSQDTLDNVRVLYAGGDCQCSSSGCNYLEGSFSVSSAILIFNEPSTAFVTRSRIEHSAGHGILRGWNGTSAVSFLGSNTFTDVAGCTETTPRDSEGRCAANPPCPKSP
jgi:hypothetical protein